MDESMSALPRASHSLVSASTVPLAWDALYSLLDLQAFIHHLLNLA
jgi:hypothetical protein